MYCERCNIDFPESLRYCKWCGQHLIRRAQATSHIRRCQNCGHAVKSAWSYCRSCGTQLVTTVVQPEVYCSGCGNVVEPPGLICKVCGLEVQQETEPDADFVAALYSDPSSYAYCASCGVKLDPQSNRCLKCGLPVTRRQLVSDALQTCPICKTLNRRGTGVCSGCGAVMSADPGTTSDPMPRSSGGPPTLPDAPIAASQESVPGAPKPQHHLDAGQAKAPGAETEINTVSYTEILSSWTPAEAASEKPHVPSGEVEPDHSRAGGLTAERRFDSASDQAKSPQIKTDEFKADELKTNAMPALDMSGADLLPTESLPTGPLLGSRSTSVFDPQELPVALEPASTQEGWHAQDYAQDSERTQELAPAESDAAAQGNLSAHGDVPVAGDAFVSDDNWVVTSHEFDQPQSQPVDRRDSETGLPSDPFTSQGNDGKVTEPQPVVSQAPDLNQAQIPPDPESKGARSRQVPPEVAHYMAYMDRQSAPQVPPQIPPLAAQPRQQGQAKKSGLLPIALAVGALAIVILAGVAFLIFRFQQRQRQNVATISIPAPSSVSVNDSPQATPQPETSSSVLQVNAPDGMVLVPAGAYIIGRDDGDKLAGPKHTETLASFYIDKTETTNAQYKRFVDATGHAAPAAWREKAFPEGKGDYPVTDVTWQDAMDYAVWAGKRLPSEAEWEAAARGREGRTYPWGNEWRSDTANIATTGIVEVGRFPEGASPSGALDMIGNVWEWTADEFKLYPGNTAIMRDLVEPGVVYRVIRGGAYDGSKKNDASYRGYLDASKAYPKTGFRCMKSASNP